MQSGFGVGDYFREGGVMAARLTDKQKKKIVADYVEIGSYNAVAKKNGVSNNTVKRLVEADEEMSQKVNDKKKENTADIINYLETKKAVVCEIIGKGLDVLNDPDKLASANPAQITTALGTLIDKFMGVSRSSPSQANANRISLAELINRPQPNRNIADFEEVEDE